MDKEKSQILVLVEGNKTDYNLMNKLLEIYGISDSHEVVSYHTNIYTLYQEMFQEGDPASVDPKTPYSQWIKSRRWPPTLWSPPTWESCT